MARMFIGIFMAVVVASCGVSDPGCAQTTGGLTYRGSDSDMGKKTITNSIGLEF